MNQLRFFLYLRKSTDREDIQTLSISGQRQSCEAFAREKGYLIVDVFVEHKSAKKPGRPVFNQMLERIESGEADAILAYHPNRLARNSKDGGELIYWIDEGKLEDLKFPTFWFENTPQGKYMLGMEFVNSKKSSDDLSVVTDRGLEQRCREGLAPINAPRGYINDRKSKRIIIDPQTAPTIRTAFELYASGGETMESISAYLSRHSILSKPTKKTPGGRPLHPDSISRILRNPFYYGSFRFSGILYEGKHEPLISKELWDRVQLIYRVRTHGIVAPRTPNVYTNLVRCGTCGMMITAESQRGHVYYRCSRKSKVVFCAEPFIREEHLDEQLSNALRAFKIPDAVADQLTTRIDAESQNLSKTTAIDLARKQDQLIDIRKRLDLLLECYLEQSIDRPTYLVRQQQIHSERATVKEQIQKLEAEDQQWLERFRKWVETARTLDEIAQNGTPFEKRALALKIFGSNMSLSGRKLSAEAVKPWSSVAKTNCLSAMVPIYETARRFFLGDEGEAIAGTNL